MSKEEPLLLNVQKSAAFLGVSVITIRQWAQTGKIKGIKIGSRGDWRFTKEELLKTVKKNHRKHVSSLLPVQQTSQESEERFRILAEAIPHIVYIAEPGGENEYYNQHWYDYTGLPQDAPQDEWTSTIHKDDLPELFKRWDKARKKGEIFEAEYRLRRFDGTYHWQLGRSVPVKDRNGKIIRWFGTATDIDERKKIEEALQQSEMRFKTLTNFAPVGIFETDADGNCLFVNKRWCEIAGLTPKQAFGQGWVQALHPEDKERVFQEWYEAAKDQKEFISVYRFQSPKGKITWLRGSGIALKTNGKIVGHIGTIMDISDHKKAEEKDRYQANLLGALTEAVFSTDTKLTVLLWNASAEKYFGWTAKEAIGKSLNDLLSLEFITSEKDEAIKNLMKNGTWSGEVIYESLKNHKKIPFLSTASVVRNAAGDHIGYVTAIVDISDLKKAIAMRDEFISVASHELKTPVTSLKMYVQVSKKQAAENSAGSRTLEKMDAQINRLTVLIDDLLNVSKLQFGKLEYDDESFDLHELTSEVVENIQTTTAKHIITVDGTLKRKVYADKDRIGQVLANLLTNAIKYSPNADKVIVRLTPQKETVVVTVEDFGIGIDKVHQKKLFERFYRVSGSEEKTFPGLGLGLYISNEIVKRYGGTMSVTSQKGKGSQFSFRLPYTT